MGKRHNQQINNLSPCENDNEREKIESTQVDSEKQAGQITENSSILTGDPGHMVYCLMIVGQVGGHYVLPSQSKATRYEHVVSQLVATEEEPKVHGLLITLNMVGGDVEVDLAIVELMVGMRKPTVSLILDGGYFVGAPLAVAVEHSFIAQSASMTIHPIHVNSLVLGIPQTLEYFQRMQERVTRFVTQNSKMSLECFYGLSMDTREPMMDVGAVLIGSDAVEEGLIDSADTPSNALGCLRNMIDKNHAKEKKIKSHSTGKSPKSIEDMK